MTRTDRWSTAHVASRDGTDIAYVTGGEGPPLVLVHGVLGDHSRWGALQPHLEAHCTVYAVDRRGRGASGDHPDYDVEREFEDVAAVVDAVGQASGSPAAVYGHSGGASYALGAATLTSNVDKLVLYEPPVDPAGILPEGFLERLDDLVAADRSEEVVETFCREVLHMSEQQIEAYRNQPSWSARVAAAHTLPRELRVPAGRLVDPERVARVDVPVLLLEGSETPAGFKEGTRIVADALRDARVVTLDGQGHTADVLAPELVAERVLAFLDSQG